MCIISGDALRVGNTRIIAAWADGGRSQVTAYSNRVDLAPGQTVRMILPVPQGPCEVVPPESFNAELAFTRLDEGWRYGGRGFMKPKGGFLGVARVGSYLVTVVPTVADLARVDKSKFGIDDATYEFVAKEYPHFGFVVCALVEGAEFHPIVYKHAMHESGHMFIPTLHRHTHAGVLDPEPDWHHDIYTSGAPIVSGDRLKEFGWYWQGASSTLVDLGASIGIDPTPLYAYRIRSYRGNHDLWA